MNAHASGEIVGSPDPSDAALVEELLSLSEKDIDPHHATIPRRNTKCDIIQQIWKLKDAAQIPMPHSETSLKRMSKNQLAELLSTMIEESSKKALANSLGATGTDPSAITLAHASEVWKKVAVVFYQVWGTPWMDF